MKQKFPPKTTLRASLKQAAFVCKFVSSGGEERWLHIAYVNVTSWHIVVLPLEIDEDPARIAAASPHVALEMKADARWSSDWAVFSQWDLSIHWSVEFWMLWGDTGRVRHAFQPFAVATRLVIKSTHFWTGLPPPPRRPPRGPREKRDDRAGVVRPKAPRKMDIDETAPAILDKASEPSESGDEQGDDDRDKDDDDVPV